MTVSLSLSVTSAFLGSLPIAVAVFVNVPASTFACVTTYVAVTVAVSPGAIVVLSSVPIVRPVIGSVTVSPLTVTLPVFSTVIV